jgi:hypothetical protein
MKSYPSISSKIDFGDEYIVFQKLDGSNIRAEWSKKQGFYKFGTRTRLLGEDQPMLLPSKDLILEKYGDELEYRFKNAKYERAITFFEYYGPKSFAGNHEYDDINNGNMDVTMIDISPYKQGIMAPQDFLDFCDGISHPIVVQYGKINKKWVDSVRDGYFLDISFEGVVLKSKTSKKFKSCKVKTKQWLNKLREHCNGNEQLFNKLK